MSTASNVSTTTVNNQDISSLMEDSVTAGAGDNPFEPSLWEDFFVTYTPPISQANTHHFHELILSICSNID
jgi:hypothetical protein